jgi:hypothetical protein
MEDFPYGPPVKLIYTLQPGEDYRFFHGRIVVVHPERPPKIITSDGAIEPLVHVASHG